MYLLCFVFYKPFVLHLQQGYPNNVGEHGQKAENNRFFLFFNTDTLLSAVDVGLHLSKYCTDDSNWKEIIDGNEIKWTEQGEKHKLCPEVPIIVPGVWTVPIVVACLGYVL